jgi:hypothetical protein
MEDEAKSFEESTSRAHLRSSYFTLGDERHLELAPADARAHADRQRFLVGLCFGSSRQ